MQLRILNSKRKNCCTHKKYSVSIYRDWRFVKKGFWKNVLFPIISLSFVFTCSYKPFLCHSFLAWNSWKVDVRVNYRILRKYDQGGAKVLWKVRCCGFLCNEPCSCKSLWTSLLDLSNFIAKVFAVQMQTMSRMIKKVELPTCHDLILHTCHGNAAVSGLQQRKDNARAESTVNKQGVNMLLEVIFGII